jgi:hypothetical protein
MTMRIDKLLVVGILTLVVMTGCKGKKEEKPATPKVTANPVASLMK